MPLQMRNTFNINNIRFTDQGQFDLAVWMFYKKHKIINKSILNKIISRYTYIKNLNTISKKVIYYNVPKIDQY